MLGKGGFMSIFSKSSNNFGFFQLRASCQVVEPGIRTCAAKELVECVQSVRIVLCLESRPPSPKSPFCWVGWGEKKNNIFPNGTNGKFMALVLPCFTTLPILDATFLILWEIPFLYGLFGSIWWNSHDPKPCFSGFAEGQSANTSPRRPWGCDVATSDLTTGQCRQSHHLFPGDSCRSFWA